MSMDRPGPGKDGGLGHCWPRSPAQVTRQVGHVPENFALPSKADRAFAGSVLASLNACRTSVLTAGCEASAAERRVMNRESLPEPCRRLLGSSRTRPR